MNVLTEAMNTYEPVLQLLLQRGYELACEDVEQGDATTWRAQNDSVIVRASTPPALLGLCNLWEERGPQWREPSGSASIYDRLLEGEVVTSPSIRQRTE